MKNNRFIKNTALLFAAMAVTKIVGALFKIPLANILGGTGMGYFSNAYGLYSPVFAVTAAGVPTVLMRLTAQNMASGRINNAVKTKKTAMVLFGMVGAAGMAVIWLMSGFFADNIACSPDSRMAVTAIAPAVFFCCIASVLRGFYEGQSNVKPTALANVTEAVSRAAIGLALSYGIILYAKISFDNGCEIFGRQFRSYEEAYSYVLPFAAGAAILAVTLSELCGLLALVIFEKKRRINASTPDSIPTDRYRHIAAKILKELVPIAAFALVMNCFSFVDIMTVTRTLDSSISGNADFFYAMYPEVISAGIKADELANFMYGSYTGIAMSLFMLIPSFAGMTEKTAIPEVTAAWEKKDNHALREKCSFIIKAAAMIGFPACFGAAALAEPILSMLYTSRAAEVSVCIRAFVVLCIGGMFMIITSALCGIFQAVGKAHIPLWLMCGGVLLKFVLNPLFTSVPEINITGAALSTIISYSVICFASVLTIRKYIKNLSIFKPVIVPMICGILCALSAYVCCKLISDCVNQALAVIFSIIFGGFVYILSLILTGDFRTKPIIKRKMQKKLKKGVAKSEKIG